MGFDIGPDKVKTLQRQIQKLDLEVKQIQQECSHPIKRIREFPDSYAGWGSSTDCEMCFKNLNRATRRRFETDVEKNYVVECATEEVVEGRG
jgi:hypothetical protein